MITNKLLLVAILAASVILPAAARAEQFRIEIGDRPYYGHGQRYWEGDYEMVWVAGHRSSLTHQWIHGHYIRGEHRRHDWERHHDEQHDNDYHHDNYNH